MAAALLLALAGGVLFFVRPSPEQRARGVVLGLVKAVNARSEDDLMERLHPEYRGWGAPKDRVRAYFRLMRPHYERLGIVVQNLDVEMTNGGASAVVLFEWSHRDRWSDPTWRQARAVVARDRDGRWKLLDLTTDIPLPQPPP